MTLQWIGETWLPRLLAAGLQSLFLVAAIALLVRWLRPSAAVRCWLWWCASLQLLLGALWPTPLELPLLPAQWRQAAEAAAAPAAPQLSPTAQLPFLVTRELATRGEAAAAPAAAPVAIEWLSWPAAFAAVWLAGLIVLAALGARNYLRMRRHVAGARDCEHAPALSAYRALGASLGLGRLPPLRVSAQIDSPQLVGPPATVLLPQRQLAQLSDDELAMALHHELTHLRRRDLWWGWVPALARCLFFFHPLAHLIAREYAIAREQACDASVLDSRRYAAHDYGRLLLRLGVAPRPAAALAGASPTYTVLKRRLLMLQNSTSPARLGGIALAAAVALLGLVPYKVTAAAADAAATTAAATVIVAPSISVAASGASTVREDSKVTIHHGKSADGEQRITEINNGDPRVWAVKNGQYFRVYDDGRYEPVRDAATRAHLDNLQRDAAKAEVEAAKAMREADRAMREAGVASREAQAETRRAQAEAARAREEARHDREQALRDAEQARRDAEQAQRDAEQARAEGQRAREQALREGKRAREQAQREGARAREEGLREAQRAREEARREGERARAEGQRAREEALRAGERAIADGQRAREEALRAGDRAIAEGRRAREQAARDSEQARRAGEDARRAGEQARRDAEQAKRNGERARLDAAQARRDAERARRNDAQARSNDEQARRNDERARRNDEQAQRDADQAQRNAEAAGRQAALAAARLQLLASASASSQRDIAQAVREAQQAHRDIEQAHRAGRIGASDRARLLALADTARRAARAMSADAIGREAQRAVQAMGADAIGREASAAAQAATMQ
ncbi:M56 family metallopeptidase [Lysobacter enzymogenes]|uniref:M56 family metallopeptidase n=1 Tax=Lysobacter enzymogenes TaxID=69 RepID=UPI00384B744F